jgi:hypothetical protein
MECIGVERVGLRYRVREGRLPSVPWRIGAARPSETTSEWRVSRTRTDRLIVRTWFVLGVPNSFLCK